MFINEDGVLGCGKVIFVKDFWGVGINRRNVIVGIGWLYFEMVVELCVCVSFGSFCVCLVSSVLCGWEFEEVFLFEVFYCCCGVGRKKV